jgi:hypothetical protein
VLAIQLGKHQRHDIEETEAVKGQKSNSALAGEANMGRYPSQRVVL